MVLISFTTSTPSPTPSSPSMSGTERQRAALPAASGAMEGDFLILKDTCLIFVYLEGVIVKMDWMIMSVGLIVRIFQNISGRNVFFLPFTFPISQVL